MRKIDIQDLIQLLGMVGIIGSLIFVGLEMRQSHRIALAAQHQARRYTLRKSCAEEGHCISWSLDCGGFPTAFLEFFVSSFKSLSRYRRHFMRSLRFNCLVEALIFPRLTKASNENIASRPKKSVFILSASKLHEFS